MSEFLFCRGRPCWLLLLLGENSRYYKRYIKQTPPKQFSILINDSNLREIEFHEIWKRTAYIEQTLVLLGTSCYSLFYDILLPTLCTEPQRWLFTVVLQKHFLKNFLQRRIYDCCNIQDGALCVNVAVVLDLSLTRSLTPTTDPVFNNATGS